ncbi:LysR family transcriptional regulator [Pseudomonas sp. TH10]|uniref:LysR family transcriptional regulator n=1 Tax=Pseudomonas sp. TH10 TaxID=2796376 RepID=UPI0027DB388D|nr:LysR family transcriptional regulator [Pseudomonas sp. TH10]
MQSILDPKWHHFIKVAKLGSLTQAAVALDVPQSMISRHISQLERECGVRLFNRTGRGVNLTEFGLQILPRIEALVEESEEVSDVIRTSGGIPIGEVRIGLLPSTVEPIAGPLYKLVHERYPRIKLQICEGSSAHLEELINEGRVDMALLLREADVSNLEETVLVQPKLMLVGRAQDPAVTQSTVELSSLQGLPLVLPSRPHPLRARLENSPSRTAFNSTVRWKQTRSGCNGKSSLPVAATQSPRVCLNTSTTHAFRSPVSSSRNSCAA